MTDEEKKDRVKSPDGDHAVEESGKGKEERMTSDGVTSDGRTVGVHKHGLFHHHCKKCEKLGQECEEYKAGWQRAAADYQNLKKEVENMRGEWARYSEQQILEEFLPVYDNFKKAMAVETHCNASLQDDKNFENWKKGIEMIMKQFEGVLKAHGIEEIKTVGEVFNPELHEAVGTGFENLPVHEDEMIVREVDAGYIMRGKVIKVAKVIVSKNDK